MSFVTIFYMRFTDDKLPKSKSVGEDAGESVVA